jgi:predicted ATP-grasp superfamily ATP-dependent carboligase
MRSSWRATSLAEPGAYLLVALSGRALAVAARRSGRRALVLDLFGDTDTRTQAVDSLVVAGSLDHGFDEAALLAGAERLAPAGSRPPYGLVYGAGLEDRPQLLAALSRSRRLYGNSPETVRLTKDPRAFFALLDRLAIPHPAVSFTRPPDPEGWLVKRIGASGGSHVTAAAAAAVDLEDRYYQRRAAGRPVGVSFLADGRRTFLLGCSEQWAWPGGDGGSFRFGGALQPAPLGRKLTGELPGLIDAIARAFGLVGLNSLDMLVDDDRFSVIEVNPRPGANLDIFDGHDPTGLFGLHLRACEGELPSRWRAPPRATAMAVVYADRPARVPVDVQWADWVADRPAPGAHVEPGAPICTVLAEAGDAAAVRNLADQRVAAVLSLLQAEDRFGGSPRDSVAATG